jgi:xanthine dehydrogenase accessory factor
MSEQNFEDFLSQFQALKTQRLPFVVVTLVDVLGGAPQNPGARIIVGSDKIYFGTIGGGKIEARALEKAREVLASSAVGVDPARAKNFFQEWNLQKDIGMTCGGVVRLFFEVFTPDSKFHVAIFGAGHVSQALHRLLEGVDCEVVCFDSRQEWLDKLPAKSQFSRFLLSPVEAGVEQLPHHSFVVSLTMGHATDLPVLKAALQRNFPFLGVMGSDVKSKKIRIELAEAGFNEMEIAKVKCPIGEDFGNNSPHEIALSICAQLLRERKRVMGY